MPKITVTIIWDDPNDTNWLNQYNIQTALSAYCPNTKFEVKEEIGNEEKE